MGHLSIIPDKEALNEAGPEGERDHALQEVRRRNRSGRMWRSGSRPANSRSFEADGIHSRCASAFSVLIGSSSPGAPGDRLLYDNAQTN